MKSLIMIMVTLHLSGMAWSKPGVEIQQQRLINVQQNYPRYQATEQNPDTQRILNEIQRINVEFGYIKKEPQISPRQDLESYFYPRPAYHPIHQRYNNGMALPPTIRQLNLDDSAHPFNAQTYFYPTPYLQAPYAERARQFQRTDKSEKFRLSPKGNAENDLMSAIEYAPQYDLYREHAKLFRDYNQEKALIQTVKKIVNEVKESNKSQQLDTAVIINKIADESRATHKKQHQNKLDVFVLTPLNKRDKTRTVEDDDSVVVNANSSKKKKVAATTAQPTTVNSKTFFSRPKPVKSNTNLANLHLKTTEKPQLIVNNYEPELSDDIPPATVKGPFSNFFNSQKEQVVEALRQGGIIIQRLRVREGGIAIAGPGGVATAGSGGTAIVGPGGIALTHPRSLAVAGPGARVFAVPETVDLERLALRSNARQLPTEGVLVATGPVIYYNPAPETLRLEHRSDPEELVTNLPFYGGAKGQVLQIRRNSDGTITTEIVKQDKIEIQKEVSDDMNSFQENLSNIQKAASELVALQQAVKTSGKLTDADRIKYASNLEKLGISAQNLAHIQQGSDGQDDFRLLFQGPLFNRQQNSQNSEKPEDTVDEEGDEDVGEEDNESSGSDEDEKPDTDSIQISSPDKDASIAEAKPVGLAIAGEGGVASSKPIATAVVGPGGLAVARPVATAIAGITPSEVQGLGIPIGNHKAITRFQSINVPTAKRYGLTSISNGIGLLVGPSFSHESRVTEKDITADDSHKDEIKAEEELKKDVNEKRIESENETSNETNNESNVENKKQEQKPYAGQNFNGMNKFQGNQHFPGPQNFPLQHPFPMGPNHFQPGQRFHGQGPNQAINQPQQQQPNQHPHSPDSILPGQYPFIPPVTPYRFNWDSAPIESGQSYDPIPFHIDNRAFNPAPVYPFVPPVNPYQFYQQFHRQY